MGKIKKYYGNWQKWQNQTILIETGENWQKLENVDGNWQKLAKLEDKNYGNWQKFTKFWTEDFDFIGFR